MKLPLFTLILFISSTGFGQFLNDGSYNPAKITVSGGYIVNVDSLPEVDPNVSADVKSITVSDLNKWNNAHLRITEYPSYSYLDYVINNVWIPGTSRSSISLSTVGNGAPTYNPVTGALNVPISKSYAAGYGITKTGTGVFDTLSINQSVMMTVARAADTIANLRSSLAQKASLASLSGYLQSEVDGSVNNEGSLTVLPGVATTSVISSNTNGSTSVTLSAGTGVSLSESGNTITISAISPTSNPTFNVPSRALNANFTISSSQNARVNYTVRISYTVTTLLGSTGLVTLQYSINGGTSWTNVCSASNNINLGIALTGYNDYNLSGEIPANALVRLNSTATNATNTIRPEQQEVLY